LVAAFLKRMSRLMLAAPPSAILAILPLMHNLIRRHPSVLPLLHHVPSDSETAATDAINDPYIFDEADPTKCNAMQSSMWELQALEDHYFLNVANFVKGFKKIIANNQIPHKVELFLDSSYDSVCNVLESCLIDCSSFRWNSNARAKRRRLWRLGKTRANCLQARRIRTSLANKRRFILLASPRIGTGRFLVIVVTW
jgi:U3 small nucleolar RNA-associated protein 19